jgi:hypothetical protein
LGKDSPLPRSIQPPEMGRVVAVPQVGGLHHRYERQSAAWIARKPTVLPQILFLTYLPNRAHTPTLLHARSPQQMSETTDAYSLIFAEKMVLPEPDCIFVRHSTATTACRGAGPFHDFYEALLAKGMKPEMARLTLARKIAAITLTLWKKEERFDAEQLKTQAAWASKKNPGDLPRFSCLGGGPSVLAMLGSRESIY